MALIKPTEHLDMDSIVYRNIFQDKSKTFSERLDLAVQYANQCVLDRIEILNTLYLFERTGCVLVRGNNYISQLEHARNLLNHNNSISDIKIDELGNWCFDTPNGKTWLHREEYQKRLDWENNVLGKPIDNQN